jgi:hypothetical protein
MVAWATVGRALMIIPTTRLYDRFGMTAPALLAAGFAAVACAAMLTRHRRVSPAA